MTLSQLQRLYQQEVSAFKRNIQRLLCVVDKNQINDRLQVGIDGVSDDLSVVKQNE